MRAALILFTLAACERDAEYVVKDFSFACVAGLTVTHHEHFETERWDFALDGNEWMRVVEFADNGSNRSFHGISPSKAFVTDGAQCEGFLKNDQSLVLKCRIDETRTYAVIVKDERNRATAENCLRTMKFSRGTAR